MKNFQVFCEKIFALTAVQNADYLLSSFNDLMDEQRSVERTLSSLLRTIRQIRIRLSFAIDAYEVSCKHAKMVLLLLETEETLLHDYFQENECQSTLPVSDSDLRWTGSASDLTELIYALHATGSVNEGKCDLSEIVLTFERIFHIQLPQVYNTFLAIRNRKKERAVFLKRLYDGLMLKMEDLDK